MGRAFKVVVYCMFVSYNASQSVVSVAGIYALKFIQHFILIYHINPIIHCYVSYTRGIEEGKRIDI